MTVGGRIIDRVDAEATRETDPVWSIAVGWRTRWIVFAACVAPIMPFGRFDQYTEKTWLGCARDTNANGVAAGIEVTQK